MTHSSFSSNLLSENNPFEQIETLESRGTTSLTYRVMIKGKSYFMKQLRPEFNNDWRYRAAFHKEFEVGSKLQNKHIVRYVKIDENEKGIYLLTEHINGITLSQKLKDEPEYFQNANHFEKFFLQLLQGIGELHRSHVAYLDLNPDNVMLTQVNNDVVIVDLGFCFANSYHHTSGYTDQFAAPELRKGALKKICASTDIYSIGCLMQHIKNLCCTDISQRLQRIINKCVSPKKQDRYATTEEVIKAITSKRKRLYLTFALTLTLGLLAVGFFHFRQTRTFDLLTKEIRWMFANPDYDFSYSQNNCEGYYKILSEDSLTCMNVTSERSENLYIEAEVEYQGKTYRNVEIAKEAYAGRGINSVYIPSGIRKIGAQAFTRCQNIVSVHLPNSVEKLDDACFSYCYSLRNIVLSPHLKLIPKNAFTACESLKEIIIPEGVTEIELDAFGECKQLAKISLPSTLKALRRGVFWKCESLKEITLPDSLESIGEYTFYYCTNLKHVYNYSPTPLEIPPIFNQSGITLHVPKGAAELYRQANNWNRTTIVEME